MISAKAKRRVCLTYLTAVILVMFGAFFLLTGCASVNSRSYSPDERVAFGHAVLGQGLDIVTTSMALDDPRFTEGNSIFWSEDEIESIIAFKVVLMGAGYLLCEYQPALRKYIWWMLGGAGYGATAWNTYQIIDNGINPWE